MIEVVQRAVEPSRAAEAPRSVGYRDAPRQADMRQAEVRQSFRMPPVVQFLANVDPGLARYLTSVALQTHLRGGDGRAVCDEVYAMAMRLGYTAVLNMQEVFATGMPSYPGQRVITTFVMVDLAPL